MPEPYQPIDITRALFMYLWNTSPDRVVANLFPDAHPSYQAEHAERLADSPERFFGKLDGDNQRLFVEQALRSYGGNAFDQRKLEEELGT